MIEVKNLYKSFGSNLVLNDVNFTIKDNEIFGLIGKSGSGKSTILNCLIGLETFEKGSIDIDGNQMENMNFEQKRQFRQNMSMIFQTSSLMNSKNIYKNIAFPMEIWKYPSHQIKQRVEELAELVGLKDKLKARPYELSGGQRQRVAIARALALKPKYILCDESTSALDPKTTESILQLLVNIWKEMGITIVMVTHEMDVVQKICQRMVLIEDGAVAAQGDVKELFLERPPALKELLAKKLHESSNEGYQSIRLILQANNEDGNILSSLAKISLSDYILEDIQTYDFHDGNYWEITLAVLLSDLSAIEKYFSENQISYKLVGVETYG